jgi:hypothetical protein
MAMLVPDCFVLFTAFISVHGFLWKKMVGYTWIHNHKKELSTWTHAEHVKKNEYLTWKQAWGNKLNPKRDLPFKRMCGTL